MMFRGAGPRIPEFKCYGLTLLFFYPSALAMFNTTDGDKES
jgi:hypothetical protein